MEQEERYLNSMAKRGYILKKYNSLGFYSFEKGSPQDLHYKIDYRIFNRKKDFEQYKLLFQDSGWIHVFGTTYSGGQYFLPASDNLGSHEIFSDIESNAARYKRLMSQCKLGLCFSLIYFISSFSVYRFNISEVGYLTPGLWDRTGWDFWFGFLFETPFVIFRFLPFVITLSLSLLYGYLGGKAKNIYKHKIKCANK
jgi:hypothetical protein